MGTFGLILTAIAAMALLLVIIIRLKIPAFIALLLVAILTGIVSGIPVDEIMPTVVDAMGSTLGNVALLVGLGAMLGAIIEKTGGAAALAQRMTATFGESRVRPALLVTSAIFAVPIFFDVGFIILLPILFSCAKAAGHRSPVFVGVPVAALMVYIHNTVPPHPGVSGSSTLLGADIGMVVLVGLALIVPLGFLAHFVGAWMTSRRDFPVEPMVMKRFLATVDSGDHPAESDGVQARPAASGGRDHEPGAPSDRELHGSVGTLVIEAPPRAPRQPSALAVGAMITLPILMISAGTIGELALEEGATMARVVSLVGQPAFALLFSVVLALWVLGVRNRWRLSEMGGLMDAALAPTAIVVLVTGAGGVFARVLTDTGIGETISTLLLQTGIPIVLMAFLLASVFKVAQGSGTVATLAAAGLLQSTVVDGGYSALQVVLIVLAIGCGSTALSHVNDSGFWITNRLLGLSVADGLRTWTVLTTVLGWSGMVLILGLWAVVS
jgi:GntP family gluconate:H+ symporter